MSERRYSDDEVAAIFERATEAQQAALPESRSSEGLTLGELQEIGRDVGLSSESVARAARSLDTVGRPQSRRLLGLPVGVGRTVELERPLTEAEWHQLVPYLRETFDARGKLSEQGPFKQWTNGNLQILLEPTPTGQRLRMKTLKGSAMSMMGVGAMMFGITTAIWIGARLQAAPFDGDGITALMLTGLGLLGAGVFQLPSWARTRQQQMEAVAGRVALMTASAEPPAPPSEGR